MRIQGYTRDQLVDQMIYVTAYSSVMSHPNINVILPSEYQILGGGAQVGPNAQGNLLIASFPTNDVTWYAQSKDHFISSPASITAYAIGIRRGFAGLQIARDWSSGSPVSTGVASASLVAPSGWVVASVGGEASQGTAGYGRLLFDMRPITGNVILVESKDHKHAESGFASAYMIRVRR
jgi:hypothetical protein